MNTGLSLEKFTPTSEPDFRKAKEYFLKWYNLDISYFDADVQYVLAAMIDIGASEAIMQFLRVKQIKQQEN